MHGPPSLPGSEARVESSIPPHTCTQPWSWQEVHARVQERRAGDGRVAPPRIPWLRPSRVVGAGVRGGLADYLRRWGSPLAPPAPASVQTLGAGSQRGWQNLVQQGAGPPPHTHTHCKNDQEDTPVSTSVTACKPFVTLYPLHAYTIAPDIHFCTCESHGNPSGTRGP